MWKNGQWKSQSHPSDDEQKEGCSKGEKSWDGDQVNKEEGGGGGGFQSRSKPRDSNSSMSGSLSSQKRNKKISNDGRRKKKEASLSPLPRYRPISSRSRMEGDNPKKNGSKVSFHGGDCNDQRK